MFHIIKPIHEIQTFVPLEIQIGLLRGDVVSRRELGYQCHDVINPIYNRLAH
jgi:hypothetical protein